MGAKKRQIKEKKKALWSWKEDVLLLGYLDFCIKHQPLTEFNKESTTGRVYSVDSPSGPYTWKQIRSRIYSLWERKSYLNISYQDIYEEGSTCISWKDGEIAMRNGIAFEVQRLEEIELPLIQMRSTIRIPESQPYTLESSSTPREREIDTPESSYGDPTTRAKRGESRNSIKEAKRKREISKQSLQNIGTAQKESRQNGNKRQKESKGKGPETTEELECAVEGLLLEDYDIGSPSDSEGDRMLFNLPDINSTQRNTSAPVRLESETTQLQKAILSSASSSQRLHDAELRKKEKEINRLEEIIKYYQEKLAQTEMQSESFALVQQITLRNDEGKVENLQTVFSNMNQEITHLKMAKETSYRMGSFTTLAGSWEGARQEMKMETQIHQIRSTMKAILSHCDDDITLQFSGSTFSAGMLNLFSFGFGFEPEEMEREDFGLLISKQSSYSIIKTLIDAAISTWVFESGFPNFTPNPAGSTLLTQYREVILAQDGAVALRNLDLASHYFLIHSSRFQSILDKQAEKLAILFSKVLSPLFIRNSSESDDNAFETWNQEEDVWKTRQQHLILLFRDSLKMKADSVLTPDHYELVRFPAGTKFNPLEMDIESMRGTPAQTPIGGNYIVEHCLYNAIKSFPRAQLGITESAADAVLPMNNFTRVMEKPYPSSTKSVLRAKAVVVLKE